jgi:hypothetical protein
VNKEWHVNNPFPKVATEEEKEAWRAEHKQNCNCGRQLLPYRNTTRD